MLTLKATLHLIGSGLLTSSTYIPGITLGFIHTQQTNVVGDKLCLNLAPIAKQRLSEPLNIQMYLTVSTYNCHNLHNMHTTAFYTHLLSV